MVRVQAKKDKARESHQGLEVKQHKKLHLKVEVHLAS